MFPMLKPSEDFFGKNGNIGQILRCSQPTVFDVSSEFCWGFLNMDEATKLTVLGSEIVTDKYETNQS